MTDDMMNLRSLLEKTPDADLLREMWLAAGSVDRQQAIEICPDIARGSSCNTRKTYLQLNPYQPYKAARTGRLPRNGVKRVSTIA